VTILISDKIDFNTGNFTRDKRTHFIITKESLHQEDVTITNCMYTNQSPSMIIYRYPQTNSNEYGKANEK